MLILGFTICLAVYGISEYYVAQKAAAEALALAQQKAAVEEAVRNALEAYLGGAKALLQRSNPAVKVISGLSKFTVKAATGQFGQAFDEINGLVPFGKEGISLLRKSFQVAKEAGVDPLEKTASILQEGVNFALGKVNENVGEIHGLASDILMAQNELNSVGVGPKTFVSVAGQLIKSEWKHLIPLVR